MSKSPMGAVYDDGVSSGIEDDDEDDGDEDEFSSV